VRERSIYLSALKEQSQYKYSDYLPVYDNETSYPPLEPNKFVDRGLSADKSKPTLLRKDDPNVVATKLTPLVGTEIRGLQLSQLTDPQKDELALLIAERGVVVFRDQDFKDIGPEKQKVFGSYFGKLHIHVRSRPRILHRRVTNRYPSPSAPMLKATLNSTIYIWVQTTATVPGAAPIG
jgi:hypothetical protein